MPVAMNQFSPEERFIGAFVSESANGKSAGAASFPKPYLQIDFDGRFDGVWGAFKENGGYLEEGNDKVFFERFYPSEGIDKFIIWLRENKIKAANRQFPYKTVELASMTKLVAAIKQQGLEKMGGHEIVGEVTLPGPKDYKLEINSINMIYEDLIALKCNIIFSVHIIQKWGKPKPIYDSRGNILNQYAPNEVIGEKLLLRDEVAEGFKSGFSNIFRFEREVINGKMFYFVEFANTDFAKNAFGIPPGKFDITGKPFHKFYIDLIEKKKAGVDLTTLQYRFKNTSILGG